MNLSINIENNLRMERSFDAMQKSKKIVTMRDTFSSNIRSPVSHR